MGSAPFVSVKICGLRDEAVLDAALDAGADLVGLVHFPKSPRHLPLERAGVLSARARGRAQRVVLLVDPDDALVDAAVDAIDPDLIQLHGLETPQRVRDIRSRTGRTVLKAVGIASADDLATALRYAEVADRLLVDAKPPAGSALPGGNGVSFDWALLTSVSLPTDTMLSGGLHALNVTEALRQTGLAAVDVSSGVEIRPGEKDPARIAAFISAARGRR